MQILYEIFNFCHFSHVNSLKNSQYKKHIPEEISNHWYTGTNINTSNSIITSTRISIVTYLNKTWRMANKWEKKIVMDSVCVYVCFFTVSVQIHFSEAADVSFHLEWAANISDQDPELLKLKRPPPAEWIEQPEVSILSNTLLYFHFLKTAFWESSRN